MEANCGRMLSGVCFKSVQTRKRIRWRTNLHLENLKKINDVVAKGPKDGLIGSFLCGLTWTPGLVELCIGTLFLRHLSFEAPPSAIFTDYETSTRADIIEILKPLMQGAYNISQPCPLRWVLAMTPTRQTGLWLVSHPLENIMSFC
jgi:hypothetical protein